MKKLICAKDIEEAIKRGEKIIYIDDSTIITPSAKDIAKFNFIEFSKSIEESIPKNISQTITSNKDSLDSEMIYNILKVIRDKDLLNKLLQSITNLKPYKYETAQNGLKIIRGESVKFDKLNTGNPDSKVMYQELINKEESSMSAGILTIDNSKFDWELKYEEINYIVDGSLTVIIDNKTFIAYPGDIVFVPSGSKVTLSSSNKTKLFYVTYLAN